MRDVGREGKTGGVHSPENLCETVHEGWWWKWREERRYITPRHCKRLCRRDVSVGVGRKKGRYIIRERLCWRGRVGEGLHYPVMLHQTIIYPTVFVERLTPAAVMTLTNNIFYFV